MLAHGVERVVCGLKHVRIVVIHIIGGRLTESLRHVHAVPVGQVVLHGPVRRVAVELVYERQYGLVARAVVQPYDAPKVVAAALLLPQSFEKLRVGHGHLPLEVVCHGVEHLLVAAVLVVGLQRPEHHHLRPHLRIAVLVVARTEETVALQVFEHGVEPHLRLLLHVLVVEYVGKAAIASKPVGHLLPAVVAAVGEPLVVVLVEPCADGIELSVESVALKLKILAQPSARLNLSDGQLEQRSLPQRSPEVGVV